MSLTIALSTLGENPRQQTGLTTLFRECVASSLELFPDISWIVFVSDVSAWPIQDPRIRVVARSFGNNLVARLCFEHLWVTAKARALGADAFLTVGTVPLRKCLPTMLQVITLHHLDALNNVSRIRSLYRRHVLARGLRVADLIIANSQWTASQLRAISPRSSDRIIVSYEGLQRDFYSPDGPAGEENRLKSAFGLQPGYLLWVSNLYSYKQPELLLRAYALLDERFRASHPLVIVGGSWKTGRERLENQARQLNIIGNLRILGWVDEQDLPMLYRNARVFCLASREETFGRSVIEAMACGTPCVVNNIPVMHEVTDGYAVIVNFTDSSEVAKALRMVCENYTVSSTLRTAGIQRSKNCSFHRLASERVAAIQNIVQR